MMSIIAILFTACAALLVFLYATACAALCVALNIVSAAYCSFFPTALAASTEQASTAILGVPSSLLTSLTSSLHFRPDYLCGTFVPSRGSQGVFHFIGKEVRHGDAA